MQEVNKLFRIKKVRVKMERTDKVKGSGFHFQRDHHHEVRDDHDKTLA